MGFQTFPHCLIAFLELSYVSLASFIDPNNVKKKKKTVFIQTQRGVLLSFHSNIVLFSVIQSMKKKKKHLTKRSLSTQNHKVSALSHLVSGECKSRR